MPITHLFRSPALALALAPCLALLFGCDTIKDHVELGAVEMRLEHFDAASSKLEPLPAPTVKRSGPSTIPLGGKLYFIGGFNTVPEPAKDVEIYDPATKTYSRGAAWPSPTVFSQIILRADDICLRSDLKLKSQFDCYDTKANAWRILPFLPNDDSATAGTLSGDLYVIGYKALDPGPGFPAFKLDVASNSWKSISNFPGSCFSKIVRSVDTALYAFPCNSTSPIYRYDAAADSWTAMPLAPADSDALSNHVFIAAGSTVIAGEALLYSPGNTTGSVLAIFNPASYDQATMMSGTRYSAHFAALAPGQQAAIATSDTFWVVVYKDDGSSCGVLHSYDPATDKWTTRVTRPTDKRRCVGTLGSVGDDVFLLTSLQDRSVSIQ